MRKAAKKEKRRPLLCWADLNAAIHQSIKEKEAMGLRSEIDHAGPVFAWQESDDAQR